MDKKDAIKLAGSAAELARVLGISRQAVSRWSGKLPPLQVYRLREIKPRWFRKKR
jgi:DNA-binding Xre family transcriptional regulator